MRYVMDTSVLAKIFVAEPDRAKAVGLLDRAIKREIELHPPSLLLYELNNVFVSKNVTGASNDNAIRFLFAWIRSRALQIHDTGESLLRRAQAIASMDTQGQGHISSFEAAFHALAFRLEATFVTADVAYARKTSALIGRVQELSAA